MGREREDSAVKREMGTWIFAAAIRYPWYNESEKRPRHESKADAGA